MRIALSLWLFVFFYGCSNPNGKLITETKLSVPYDAHVHIMSPSLIADFKNLGIPFSRPDPYYFNLDTIFNVNKAHYIDLIGMGYIYGNSAFYQGLDAHKKMRKENDYLLSIAKPYPKKVFPFFAIDPLKEYAMEELERCYQINPKSGLKLHFNASQVDLSQREHLYKVRQVFSKAADYNLSILLHFENTELDFGKADLEILADSILNDLTFVKLRIAHFGTSGGFSQSTKDFSNAFIMMKEAGRFAERHQIYLDISAVGLDKESEGVPQLTTSDFDTLRKYVEKIGFENIVFGSDYPLYNSQTYARVLKSKLNLTDEELKKLMTRLEQRN